MALSCCKKFSALNRGITSNNNGDFYCINCPHSFRTENKLKKHYDVCKNHNYCYVEMPKEDSNLRYKTPKEIPVVFHNGSTYDYHFIVKELAKEFEGQFECLGEITEKYISFSVPIKKEPDNGKSITYKIKFIDSFRFMSSSLSSLAGSLSEGLPSYKCAD